MTAPTAIPSVSLRRTFLLAIACALLIGGCARLPDTGITALKPETWSKLEGYLLANSADVDQFRLRGPFEVTTLEDYEVRLSSSERVLGDLYLSAAKDKAPLVILLHGHDNSKEDHAYQALHLATWGLHSYTLALPNHGPWIGNGKTLAKIVDLIHRRPEILDPRIDARRIVIVGHSFGGTSAAVALAEGAPAAGGILLDPATAARGLPAYLGRIDKPVLVLGADESVSVARGRPTFYRYMRKGIAELSIRGADHEDAQFGFDGGSDAATEAHQISFVAALTAAAFSLASTGKFDYAWASFDDALRNGKLISPKKK